MSSPRTANGAQEAAEKELTRREAANILRNHQRDPYETEKLEDRNCMALLSFAFAVSYFMGFSCIIFILSADPEGDRPQCFAADGVTFISILSICGWYLFPAMITVNEFYRPQNQVKSNSKGNESSEEIHERQYNGVIDSTPASIPLINNIRAQMRQICCFNKTKGENPKLVAAFRIVIYWLFVSVPIIPYILALPHVNSVVIVLMNLPLILSIIGLLTSAAIFPIAFVFAFVVFLIQLIVEALISILFVWCVPADTIDRWKEKVKEKVEKLSEMTSYLFDLAMKKLGAPSDDNHGGEVTRTAKGEKHLI